MSRVVLVAPPWYRLMNWHLNEMPVALCSLAGTLKREGHQAYVLNADLVANAPTGEFDQRRMFDAYPGYLKLLANPQAPIWAETIDRIERLEPDVLGMTVQVGSFGATRIVAELFKERNPDVPVVVGGPLASIDPERTLAVSAFDYAIQGEGEGALAELVGKLSTGEAIDPIANLVFQGDVGVTVNDRRPAIEDLDTLPFPDRDALVDLEDYPRRGLGALFTARGCPFHCTYCAASGVWGRRVRFRSPQDVINEMCEVHERFGVRHFNFKDDTFTIRRDRIAELCELIRSRLGEAMWACKTRADCVDERLIRQMASAGCVHVEIGLESGCPEVLEQVRKGETVEQIRRAGLLFRKAGIPTLVNIIVGFPDETPDQMRQSLAVATSMRPGRILASLLSPYPGTEIHEALVQAGRLDPATPWETYFHASAASCRLNADSVFAKTVEEIFGAVERYNRSRRRRLRSFGHLALTHPATAVGHLKRYLKRRLQDREARD